MKKEYIMPTMQIVEVETENVLAVSSVGVSSNSADNTKEALSNDRRGGWGDLWGSEE